MCTFAVAEDKLRMPTVVEGKPEFLCSGSRKEMIRMEW